MWSILELHYLYAPPPLAFKLPLNSHCPLVLFVSPTTFALCYFDFLAEIYKYSPRNIMSLSRTISLPLRHHAASDSPTSLPLPLMRYGSFGNRRLLLKPSNSNAPSFNVSKLVQSMPTMPMEMLEHILERYADSILSPAYISGGSQKTCYKVFFAPSTLVSKDFRQLALRAFFRALVFRTTDDCSCVLRFLDLLNTRYLSNGWIGGYRWVRFVKWLSQAVSVLLSLS